LYDASGNTAYDPNKKLTFQYNHLNLPYKILGAENDELQMLYSADGALLQRKYIRSNIVKNKVDYIGDKDNRTVSFIKREQSHKKWLCSEGTATNWIAAKTSAENLANGDGRVIKNGTVFQYEYNIKDHLGNVRATFCDVNNNGIISNSVVERRSRNDYYSFGMEHFKGSNEYTAQKNKKNKTLKNEKG
jgi:hypothetical protein